MEFKYIDIKNELYSKAKEIRIRCFFNGMKNADDLINDKYEKNGHHLICIGESKEVLGTGRLNVENTNGIISQMAIKPKHQKLGIGKEILNHLLLKCENMGLDAIELNARETAINFYIKMGFETSGDKYPSQKTGIIHQKMIKKHKNRAYK
ncbi:GNAT family N-acetyltransferase [Marivirga salinae]|uniref:GNAT family N-acetyltransferase n=1 Tax=Marivirga salinarum TaxID=3059078 RepID=A0AA51NAA5_9BACT|nr:GNAT family N-acetyltransferase [Marivirga sp. BDSF4-3]WMN11692.1 GNAT family N-acetyltransferase [Marivirga sp. BDSF4-3]